MNTSCSPTLCTYGAGEPDPTSSNNTGGTHHDIYSQGGYGLYLRDKGFDGVAQPDLKDFLLTHVTCCHGFMGALLLLPPQDVKRLKVLQGK